MVTTQKTVELVDRLDTSAMEYNEKVNDLKTASERFDTLMKVEIDLETTCQNSVFERINSNLEETNKNCLIRDS